MSRKKEHEAKRYRVGQQSGVGQGGEEGLEGGTL